MLTKKKIIRNKDYDNKYILHQNKYYEEEYFNETYSKCYECNEYHLIDEMTDVGGRFNTTMICESCLDENYSFCEECDSYSLNENIIQCDWCGNWTCRNCSHNDGHGTHLCEKCWLECYVCDDCSRYCSDDYYHDGYCESCYDYHHIIHDYDYKPYPEFYGKGHYFFGVELEVKGYNCQAVAQQVIENEEVYCKEDSSIGGGFEIVSHPCTLNYHLNNLQWKNIMQICLDNNYTSHDAVTCGLHVHISRDAFGEEYEIREMNLAKFLYLFEKFWNEIKIFSRRTEAQIDKWAKNYGLDTPEKILEEAKSSGRYYAVNLENYDTIEIRIFRGTLNYNTFVASLQFCNLLISIINKNSIKEIQQLQWKEIIKKAKKYAELMEYLNNRNLI